MVMTTPQSAATPTLSWVTLYDRTPNRATAGRILTPQEAQASRGEECLYGTYDDVEPGERVWAGQFITGW
jgi:hypothetical protein